MLVLPFAMMLVEVSYLISPSDRSRPSEQCGIGEDRTGEHWESDESSSTEQKPSSIVSFRYIASLYTVRQSCNSVVARDCVATRWNVIVSATSDKRKLYK